MSRRSRASRGGMGNEFSHRLKKLRERKGISRRVLSEICGLSKNMVAAYECGEYEPTASVIKTLAEHLNVSADYLLGLKENF